MAAICLWGDELMIDCLVWWQVDTSEFLRKSSGYLDTMLIKIILAFYILRPGDAYMRQWTGSV